VCVSVSNRLVVAPALFCGRRCVCVMNFMIHINHTPCVRAFAVVVFVMVAIVALVVVH